MTASAMHGFKKSISLCSVVRYAAQRYFEPLNLKQTTETLQLRQNRGMLIDVFLFRIRVITLRLFSSLRLAD
jgi:hypothetical protein